MCTVTTLQEQWHFNEGRGQYVNTAKEQQSNRTTEQKTAEKKNDRSKEFCTSEDSCTLIYFRMYRNVQTFSVTHLYVAKEQKEKRTKEQANRVHGNLSALRVWTFVW